MRLIDADAYQFPGDLVNEPTIDAVPVVRCKDCCHAEVVRNKGVVMYIGCGYFPNTILSKDFYCHNCGAKMDGGNDG